MPAGAVLLHQPRGRYSLHQLVLVPDIHDLDPRLRTEGAQITKLWPRIFRSLAVFKGSRLRSLCPNCQALTPAAPSAEATPPPAGAANEHDNA